MQTTAAEILEHTPARLVMGQLCRLARIANGGNMRRWAAALGVSRQSVIYYEAARMCPGRAVRVRIAANSRGTVRPDQLDRAACLFSYTYRRMQQRLHAGSGEKGGSFE